MELSAWRLRRRLAFRDSILFFGIVLEILWQQFGNVSGIRCKSVGNVAEILRSKIVNLLETLWIPPHSSRGGVGMEILWTSFVNTWTLFGECVEILLKPLGNTLDMCWNYFVNMVDMCQKYFFLNNKCASFGPVF